MSLSREDPRLTAHALGELGPEELRDFSALLQGDPRALAELEAIGETCAQLERELSRGEVPALSAQQRAKILAAADGARRIQKVAARRKRWMVAMVPPAIAAVVVLSMWRGERHELQDEPLALDSRAGERAAPAEALQPAGRASGLREAREFGMQGVLKSDRGNAAALRADPGVGPGWGVGHGRLAESALGTGPASDRYGGVEDQPFLQVASEPRSTFSIDVDTASYALVRSFLDSGTLPPRDAVRIEELINYFSYRYPRPSGEAPVSIITSLAAAPWNPSHQLARIALHGRPVSAATRPAANLVFLIDVSGSMAAENKLPLVKSGLRQLTSTLRSQDRVSIVTYAGNSGLALPPTSGDQRDRILKAIDRLEAAGGTNGGSGIQLAYEQARRNFARGKVNRVLLATDGDFNVGITSEQELVEAIQRQAKSGVFLSVLGFGRGNYQDSMLEKLADKGNGNYAYIDEPAEAQKVLVEQAASTLVTVAKDVKLQIEFNPTEVSAFRLIGYENRQLEHRDFNDDDKDAGEIGAGHSVTALYEIVPARLGADALKFQPAQPQADGFRGQVLHVKLRYQPPAGGPSQLLEQTLRTPVQSLDEDFRFAAAVAEFGMLLRKSAERGNASYSQVLQLAEGALGDGPDRAARQQFLQLVRRARKLAHGDSEE